MVKQMVQESRSKQMNAASVCDRICKSSNGKNSENGKQSGL
jgi:hypothetical protein